MWGLMFLGVMGAGAFVESCRKGSYNAERRNNSRNQGKQYYMDYNGNTRRVDNDHEVLQYMTDWSNGDRVDIDVKTGEYINRVPNSDRVRKENWIKECEEKAKKSKKEAIEKGETFYVSTVQVDDASKHSMYPGTSVYHRVSDDLPLEDFPIKDVNIKSKMTGLSIRKRMIVMKDYNLGFYVGTEKDYNKEDYPLIEEWKKLNWYIINEPLHRGKASFKYIYNNGFFEQMNYDTPEKKEAYARKIGAFL